MIRLKDIASRAGVSVMTVSRVLRGAPDISASTETRVRAIAEQLGYVPNIMASGLRTRTTRLFGLVVPSVTDPIYGRVAAVLEERAHELGYDLVVAHSLNRVEREEACIRRLLARRVDGMFLAPVYRLAPTSSAYEELRHRGCRVVLLGHRAHFCEGFANVAVDDLGAAHNAAKYLLQLGHRRIAFFAGPSVSPSAQERFEGYRRALREAELEVDDHLVFSAGMTMAEGAKAALQMLNERTQVTAIQAVSDLAAMGAADVLLNQGMRIPQDLSVVGFGNILASEFFRVPLTTVRQPKSRLGAAAMDAMVRLLRGTPAEPVRLQGGLIIRASTGPPPGQGLQKTDGGQGSVSPVAEL